MPTTVSFRSYSTADREACLAIFDANCPGFFAPNERTDYINFLDGSPEGYEVCEIGTEVVGAFGLLDTNDSRTALCWILLDPRSQGVGIGSAMMRRAMSSDTALRSSAIEISTSQKSAPFFARFGAVTKSIVEDGWDIGLDRIDMELYL